MRFANALQLPARLPLALPAAVRARASASGPGLRTGVTRPAASQALPLTVSAEWLDRPAPQAEALDALDPDQRARLVGEW